MREPAMNHLKMKNSEQLRYVLVITFSPLIVSWLLELLAKILLNLSFIWMAL